MFTTIQPPNARPIPSTTSGEIATNPWLLWRADEPAEAPVLSIAELAECGCPELCDRDHANE